MSAGGHYGRYLHYTGDRFSGYERLRVDVGSTGFYEGREFYSVLDFSIPEATTLTLEFDCAVPRIILGQELYVGTGSLLMRAVVDGTPAGTFGTPVPALPKNRMLERRFPYYTGQATLASGGSVSGGTVSDVVRLSVVEGPAGSRQSAGAGVDQRRGLPAGKYHIQLQNIGAGTCTGVFDIWWEERAKHPDWEPQ